MKAKLCIAAAALLALTACGGGGGDDNNNSASQGDTVPTSALASLSAFTSWLGSRPASDVKEALMMNSELPPTSDTEEPVDIN
jgi:ABC-type glycerol-3-phosphate transport system substrate-binding protein